MPSAGERLTGALVQRELWGGGNPSIRSKNDKTKRKTKRKTVGKRYLRVVAAVLCLSLLR